MHVTPDGAVYVIDHQNDRILRYSGSCAGGPYGALWNPGAEKGKTVAGGNGRGSASNQFNGPCGVFVTPGDNGQREIYVADAGNHRVMRWREGHTKGVVVAGGNGRGNRLHQLYDPCGVVVDDGRLYVCDRGNHRVICLGPCPPSQIFFS